FNGNHGLSTRALKPEPVAPTPPGGIARSEIPAMTTAIHRARMPIPFVAFGGTVRPEDEPPMTDNERAVICGSSRIATIRPVRVLIVEDELRMAGLIRRGLTNEGLAADVAGTGEDALWMAQAHAYDAIVLDVMLPGLNGFETCKRLRKDGVWAPVLML